MFVNSCSEIILTLKQLVDLEKKFSQIHSRYVPRNNEHSSLPKLKIFTTSIIDQVETKKIFKQGMFYD